MRNFDAVVLGAGIAGLAVARELAKLKQRVLLLEREESGQASRAAAGILDPYTEADRETPLLRIALKAFEFYPPFLDEITGSRKELVEYEKLGILYPALTAEDETFLKGRFEWQKRRGLPAESLSRDEARKLEPLVSNRMRSGVYYPEIPKLNAEKLAHALFKATQAAGVQIEASEKNVALWKEGERIRGVRMSTESVESPVVVSARGSWSGLDENLGIKLEVKPVRGQILILRSRAGAYPQHILHTVRYAYIVPWPEGRLLVGSTLESAGFDDRVTPEGKEDILNRAGEILEGIRSLPIEKSWAGLRPFAPSGVPLIGPTRLKGLYLATGYYRSGILIGSLAGKLLAEGIVSGKFSPLLEPFYPEVQR